MEQITIGQVVLGLTLLVSFIGSVKYLKTHLKKWVSDALKEQFASVNDQVVDLKQHIDDIDMATCKNFLVARLSELEKGLLWDEIETERFWEQYEHYIKHGGNTYIKNKVEKLKEKGIL